MIATEPTSELNFEFSASHRVGEVRVNDDVEGSVVVNDR